MSQEHILSATLELKDKFTTKIQSANSATQKFGQATTDTMKKFSQQGGGAFKDFTSRVKQQVDNLNGTILPKLKKGVSNALNGMRGAFQKGLGSIKGVFGTFFNSFTGGLLGMQAINAAGSFAKNTLLGSFELYAELQDKLARNMSLMGVDAKEFATMKKQVEELGAATEYSAAQVADVHKYLAMAGWNTSNIKIATGNILEFASATGTDLAESANIAASYLNAFEMKAEELPRLLDVMSTTALKSATNINQIAQAFQGMAGVNKGRDSIEELGIITGLLANLGTTGSDAGTFYKSALSRLTSGATDIKKAAKKIGVDFYKNVWVDENGKKVKKKVNKSTLEIFEGIAQNISKFDVATQNELYKTFFGIGHVANARKLINALATEEYPRLVKEMENAQGATNRMYKTWTENSPQFVIAELSSAWEGLRLKMGESLAPYAVKAMKALTAKLSEWTEGGTIDRFMEKSILFMKAMQGIVNTFVEAAKIAFGWIKKIGDAAQKAFSFISKQVTSIKERYTRTPEQFNQAKSNLLAQKRELYPEEYKIQMEQDLQNGAIFERHTTRDNEVDIEGVKGEYEQYKQWLSKYDPELYRQHEQVDQRTQQIPFQQEFLTLPSNNGANVINITPTININGQNMQETKEQLQAGFDNLMTQIVAELTGAVTNTILINQ